MTPQPIETARDPDLRHSMAALQRAAQRAWDVALQTGTSIVVSRDGVIEWIDPAATEQPPMAQEPQAPFKNEA